MLTRDIRLVRILRKTIHGQDKYFVQLSVEGAPAVKRDSEGQPLHAISDARIGIYIDTRALVVASSDGYHTIDLTYDSGLDDEILRLNLYMKRSRYISNPGNFDEKGNMIAASPEWHYSSSYKKARTRAAELSRIAAERRRIRTCAIANEVLTYGSHITVNDYSFKAAGRREGDMRKAGHTIERNAPAGILETIDRKLVASGREPMKRVRIEVDHDIPEFRKHYARQLLNL